MPSWNLGGRAEGLESPAALLGDLRCRLGLAWELLLNLSSCPGGEEGGATKAWRSLLLAPPPEPHPRQGVGPAGIWGLGCACPSKQCSILLHSSPTSLPALSKKGECRHTPPGGGGPRSVIPPLRPSPPGAHSDLCLPLLQMLPLLQPGGWAAGRLGRNKPLLLGQ